MARPKVDAPIEATDGKGLTEPLETPMKVLPIEAIGKVAVP